MELGAGTWTTVSVPKAKTQISVGSGPKTLIPQKDP